MAERIQPFPSLQNPSSGDFITELLHSENFGEVSMVVMNILGREVFFFQQPLSIGTADWNMEIDPV